MIHILYTFFSPSSIRHLSVWWRPVFVLFVDDFTSEFDGFERGYGVFRGPIGVDGVRGDCAETVVHYGVCVWHRSVYLYREKEEKAIVPSRDVSYIYISNNLSKYNVLCYMCIIQWIIMSIRANVRDLFVFELWMLSVLVEK